MIAWLVACRTSAVAFEEHPADRPDDRLPMIVVVHGYGDVPGSMIEMVRACSLDARIIAPRGPRPGPQGRGHSWYDLEITAEGVKRDPARIRTAADQLAALIGELRASRDESRVVLTGFSQGGVLSFAVATLHPDVVDFAVPIAGALQTPMPPGRAPSGAPPIHALHGATDGLFPVAETRATVDLLAASGWDAELQAFDAVGHSVSPEVHRALCRELAAAIEPREATGATP